jgi:hypothetical protein
MPLLALLAVLALAALCVAGYVALGGRDALARSADAVIAACADHSYPPSCYDAEIPKLMDRGLSMEEAFAVARAVQEATDGYYYCHVLGHNLSAKETAKDPSQWTEVVARCPVGMCSNGCLHGAAQERFRQETPAAADIDAALPEIEGICESTRTAGDRASCTHALGHLFMYLAGGDAGNATALCDRATDASLARTCYEGAYMQVFQPLEPEDRALTRDIDAATPDDARAYCAAYSGDRLAACSRESWPVYGKAIEEPSTVEAFCALVPGERAAKDCYSALSYILAAKLLFDEERIAGFCAALPAARRGLCFGNAVSRYLATDARLIPDAAALCALAEERGAGEGCYRGLLLSAAFTYGEGSEEAKEACSFVPDSRKEGCAP